MVDFPPCFIKKLGIGYLVISQEFTQSTQRIIQCNQY